jgi:L-gulonate 3-dehydrogenase
METVVIVGSGLVGKSWAMLWASGGHQVRLYDVVPEALAAAPGQIKEILTLLEAKGQLRPSKLNVQQQLERISVYPDLKEALKGATYIQENTPEALEMKRNTFKLLDTLLNEVGNTTAIIGSSTSTIQGSLFTNGLSIEERSIVVHPVNPPYFVNLVELIPTPGTKPEVGAKLRGLMEGLGMKPVVLNKELPGFALNRIQYAILNECWRLVNDGVLSVADVDTVMKEGLAPRYVFMGPLETAQLNAHGFVDYCQRYGKGINSVSQTMQEIPLMSGESCAEIDRQLQSILPDAKLPERRAWRDENLARLASFKRDLGL